MTEQEFIDRINKYPHTSTRLTYVENFYKKYGCELMTYRDGDDILLQLLTDEDYPRLLYTMKINLRENNLKEDFIYFYRQSKPIIDQFVLEDRYIRLQMTVTEQDDIDLVVNDDNIPLNQHDEIVIKSLKEE